MANIVFIGAGSACFGMSMFRDLFTTPELVTGADG
jgi:alpha-galactosidase/6-phospho-beta-glucosidase family protein